MLTTKQRADFKSQAVKEKIVGYIGKEGLTESVIQSLELAIKARELIKIKLQNGCDTNIDDVCNKLCRELKAEPVLKIGSVIVLYRKNEKKKK